MMAIFRKDLREQLKWAALVAAGMILAIARGRGNYLYYALSSDFNVASSVGCAAAGLLLGLMLTVLERRRDSWAFLVHRPVTRSRLFAGKALAGVALLWLSAGLPLLGWLIYEAYIGKRAYPFYWSMGLPVPVDLMTGTVYLFCGMVIGLREARWYGSRALFIAMGLGASGLAYAATDFSTAMIAVSIVAALASLAAYVAFVGNEAGATGKWAGRICLGVGLYAALSVLWGIAGGIMGGLLLSNPDQISESSQFIVLADGRIVRRSYQYGTYGTTRQEVFDLGGGRLEPETESYARSRLATAWTASYGTDWDFLRLTRAPILGGALAGYRSDSTFYERQSTNANQEYLLVFCRPERCLELRANNARDPRLLGTIGANGFVPPGQGRAQPLNGDHITTPMRDYSLVIGGTVWKLDIPARQLRSWFVAPQGEQILSLSALPRDLGPDSDSRAADMREEVLVGTGQNAYVVDRSGRVRLHLDLSELRTKDGNYVVRLWYAQAKSQWVVQLAEMTPGGLTDIKPSSYLRLDADGKVLERGELPALPTRPFSATSETPVAFFYACYLGVAPTWLPAGAAAIWLTREREQAAEDLHRLFVEQRRDAIWAIALMLAGGILAAGLTFWIGRRYAFAKRRLVGWCVGNFLLSWPGVLLMLCLLDWPARLVCPACGRRRIVTRQECEHCGKAWGEPARDGTEIMVDGALAIPAIP
jgi:hypothetical protein